MTMSTLLSFLGKGRADLKTGYRIASYRFDAGFARSVPFFGLALNDYLKPDRLVLVGTAGSMWDVFFRARGRRRRRHARTDERRRGRAGR
jgi:CRISPR-associated Csx2 family protein